jgi:hypothetical protein
MQAITQTVKAARDQSPTSHRLPQSGQAPYRAPARVFLQSITMTNVPTQGFSRLRKWLIYTANTTGVLALV